MKYRGEIKLNMRLLVLLSIPLLCLKGYAQEAKKPPRTCRVLYVEKPAKAPDEAFLYDGTESKKVILPKLNLSEVIDLPPGDITIGFSKRAIGEEEILPAGAPRAKIPEAYSDVYLLLFPDPTNEYLPFKINVVNIAGVKLKKGHTLWINTSKFQIAGQTGNTEFIIPASKLKITEPPLRDHGFYLAKFLYRTDPKAKFLPVMRKNWWFDANSRHLGFIVDTGAKMPRIYTMRDRRPPKPVAPEGAAGGANP